MNAAVVEATRETDALDKLARLRIYWPAVNMKPRHQDYEFGSSQTRGPSPAASRACSLTFAGWGLFASLVLTER